MVSTKNAVALLTPADLREYRLLEEHVVSPDGTQVAYTVSTVEGDELRYLSAIWLAEIATGVSRQITFGEKGDSAPRWRPDGKTIGFISDRGDGPQVHQLVINGDEITAVTAISGGVSGYSWSPDGGQLAVVATGEKPVAKQDSRRITNIHYKNDGLGLLSGAHVHLWIVDVGGSGLVRQLTSADQDDMNPVWRPDGTAIAFNRARPSEGGSAPFNDIWTIEIGTGNEENLTQGRGPCFGPTFSPDGKTIAFVGHTEPNDIWWGKNFTVWTVPAGGGSVKHVTEGFKEIAARAVFGDPWRGIPWPAALWSADGSSLHFVSTVGGNAHLYSVPADGSSAPKAITSGRRVVTDFSIGGETIVFGAMSSTQPTDLFVLPTDSAAPSRLTDLNADFITSKSLAEAELIDFASFDGQATQAWLQPPTGFVPNSSQIYPLVISIHGGPHGAYGEAFHHSFQTFASHGYFVLYVNPRGSQGYGEEFAKQCIGDWGGGDYQDIMAALDHVIARGSVDTNRLYSWGASYGGFMTTWMAGQTDRFAAICSVIPVTDLISFYGTSDIGHYFAPFEMGGQPWEVRDRYVAMSPITHAANVTSPILLVHHENDLRCPISQSEQYFVTLKAMGKKVEFLRISEASHGIVPPARAHAEVIGLEAALDWFARYSKTSGQ